MKSTRKSAASFLALAALVALCQPLPKAEAQPLFVQLAYTCPQTPQNQVAVDYDSAQTAGNLNILAIGWNDQGANITNVTDSAGNTYQVAVPTFRGGGLSQAIYYATNILSGANTVTVMFDIPAKYVDLRVTEYSGLSQDHPFDAGASAAGTGALADSGPVTTSQANELLFAAGMTGSGFNGPADGWVLEVITTPDSDIVQDMVAASPGTYNVPTSLGSAGWLMQVAAFRTGPPPTSGGGGKPTLVQQHYACPQSPQTQVTVAYTNAQTAGNLNILAIGWNDVTANITNVTDSAGNTYQMAVPTFRGGGLSQAIYYAANSLSGSNTVTVMFDQPAKFVDLRATEYSGLSHNNPFDAAASASGTSALADSGPVTTGQTNELLFAAGMTVASFTGPGTGWVKEVITQPNADIVEDMVAASAGSYSATAPLASSSGWLMQVAAFRTGPPPSSGGGGIGFVQQNYACPQTPESEVAVTYPAAQTAGNLNILAIGWNDVTANITDVTDSVGNTYRMAVPTFRGGGLSQAIYYAANILSSGSNTVTVTFDQPAQFVDLRATEYSGLSQDNPFDAGASASGTSALADSGLLMTSQTNELLFAAGMVGTSFTGPGAGHVQRVITQPNADIVEDMVAVSVRTYNATAPLASGGWLMQVAAFKTGPQPTRMLYVQGNYACPQTDQSQVSVTYTNTQTAGNVNILAIGWNDVTANLTSVTDSAGNTYQAAVPTSQNMNGLSQAIYYATNILSRSNTVTVMFDQPAHFVDLRATEYAGLIKGDPFDVGTSGTGNGLLADSGPLTTGQTNELLFAAGTTTGSFSGPGVGYVIQMYTRPNSDIVEDMVADAAGTYNAMAPCGSSGWVMQVAAFKATPPPIWSGPLPVLQLDSSNGLKLLWLEKASAAGFVLESSDKLSPANWAPVPDAPAITNNIAFVTVSSPTGSKFYRLHAQQ